MEEQNDSRAYYEILGVDKNASLDEIKSAYEEKSKECKEKIEKINAAYEVLSDSQKRQEYDAFLEQKKKEEDAKKKEKGLLGLVKKVAKALTKIPTHYEILGVEEKASLDEIKSAYDKKTKEAEENLKKINAAYEVLSDSQKRQEHDEKERKYEILGLNSNAKANEIKTAYDEKSWEYKCKIKKIDAAYKVLFDSQKRQEDVDKNASLDEIRSAYDKKVKKLEAEFKEIETAYEEIFDDQKRQEYDAYMEKKWGGNKEKEEKKKLGIGKRLIRICVYIVFIVLLILIVKFMFL